VGDLFLARGGALKFPWLDWCSEIPTLFLAKNFLSGDNKMASQVLQTLGRLGGVVAVGAYVLPHVIYDGG
jgi:hypothetical protein